MTDVNKVIADILNANPEAMLTGSRALIAQGFKVRNEPNDIDIWLPDGVHFNLIPGMMYPKPKAQVEEELAASAGSTNTTAAPYIPQSIGEIDEAYAAVRIAIADVRENDLLRRKIKNLLNEYNCTGVSGLPAARIFEFKKDLETVIKQNGKSVMAQVHEADVMKAAGKQKDEAPSGIPFDYKMTIYKYENIKIEVHGGRPGETRNSFYVSAGNYHACDYLSIINEKLAFVRKGSPTLDRHRNDVIYFLTANF